MTTNLPYTDKSDVGPSASEPPGGLETEKELATLIAAGDEMAFKQLYRLLLPNLKGMGMKMLKSEHAVAEVLQESLIRLWVHREKLKDVHSPRAWVFRIYSNECFRYLKKNGLQSIPLELVADVYLPEAAGGPEQQYSMQETRHIIHDAVSSLSPRQREIYKLSRDRGLKVPEIAAELGLASKYVKKTLMTALHNVRRQLVKAGKIYLFFL